MLKPRLIEFYTGAGLRGAQRYLLATLRRLPGRARRVHYFHQCDDPYSHLLLQVLPELRKRHAIELVVHLVGAPDAASTPDRERFDRWARADAVELAQALNLTSGDVDDQPAAGAVAAANAALCALGAGHAWANRELAQALAIGQALWTGDVASLDRLVGVDADTVTRALRAGAALRQRLGHYSSATLYFEGEWYWGVDRLPHLEQRLAAERSVGDGANSIVRLPALSIPPPRRQCAVVLHFYCSLRSPYSYLAVRRCLDLADHYGAKLKIRFVLPMVMRGLPVPKAKRLYIVRDAKREAERLGIPFGRIADPLGLPTERGLAVLNHAIAAGKGAQFLDAFTRAVWSEGIDAGSDKGLLTIAKRAELDESFVRDALADPSWRDVAQANRDEMMRLGLWGVPCFRVDDGPAYWGQDRMWLVERDLASFDDN